LSVLSGLIRKLPGYAWRKPNKGNDVVFLKGYVLHSGWGQTGPVTQTIQTDSKMIPLVKLIGDSYAYWCSKCSATIWQQELIMAAAHVDPITGEKVHHFLPNSVTGQKCPFCMAPISPLQPGDKVKCHYRFSDLGHWGGWWAEKVDF
jgi:hypothetical protein